MSDLINVLPDSIANQIAAGEVVQRPASVVKELLENSVDAGSSRIRLAVYEGGKNGIQVIDNGLGMSPIDARLCFERHATSKITKASDLESIVTMGFRGEALASIAAVAEVTLITRRSQDELGVKITLSGSTVIENTPTACSIGATFFVRNLFFNVPARRRFLKSTAVEFKHVVAEFLRVALSNPQIAMALYHQQVTVYNLAATNPKQRILDLFGKELNESLIPIDLVSDTVTIQGFIIDPLLTKKRYNEQYLFVNGRYMRSAYFNRAIINAFERLVPNEVLPSFFLYFTVDPQRIDVNIHPTKTEIKFEDEHVIWEILFSTVRSALGRNAGLLQITTQQSSLDAGTMEITNEVKKWTSFPAISAASQDYVSTPRNRKPSTITQSEIESASRLQTPTNIVSQSIQANRPTKTLFADSPPSTDVLWQTLTLGDSFIVVVIKDTLRIIDQHRAHARVLYERLKTEEKLHFQSILYPVELKLIPSQKVEIESFVEQMSQLGLSIELTPERNLQLRSIIHTTPPLVPELFLQELFQEYNDKGSATFSYLLDKTRAAMALAMAYKYSMPLPVQLRSTLIDDLMACAEPMLDPKRRPTMHVLDTNQIQRILH